MDRTQIELRNRFRYCEETGHLYRKTGNNKDKPAFQGCTSNRAGTQGTLIVDGHARTLRATKAVWIFHNGDTDRGDYIITLNNDNDDTRIENLECVDAAMARSIRHHSINKNNRSSKVRGVSRASETAFSEGWEACWTETDGTRRSKFFKDLDDAVKHRKQQEKRFYPFSKV